MTDVLLLHGQPGSGGDWAGVAGALRERGLEVLAPDRPGYGTSHLPAGGFEHNARAMAALLDGRRAVVAGHSWGAGVALALAQLSPELVEALVLVAPVTPFDRLGRVDRLLAARLAGPLVARAAFLTAGAALARPRLRRRLEGALPGADLQRWSDIARDWRSFWIEQRALFDGLPALPAAITVPATVVVGTRDHVIDLSATRRYANAAGARLVEVRHAGHLLPMQRPAEVADAISAAARAISASLGAR